MTDERRLSAIRARADAATPGPWRPVLIVGCSPERFQVYAPAADNLNVVQAGIGEGNALFVSHARDDLPWLLDLVRQQARVIADLQEESDAARLAVRYREALEGIAGGKGVFALTGSIARRALEGEP